MRKRRGRRLRALLLSRPKRKPLGAYLDFAASKYRHLHRLTVRAQRLIAMLRKPITEFLQQCGVGVENVRHALETLVTPLTIF
jgi:hypothetical protein